MRLERFNKAEDDYFLLKRELEEGHITRAQFEQSLRGLGVRAADGRLWMLGADSGKWYYYDGQAWVAADPYAAPLDPPRRQASRLPILILGGASALVLLALCAILFVSSQFMALDGRAARALTPTAPLAAPGGATGAVGTPTATGDLSALDTPTSAPIYTATPLKGGPTSAPIFTATPIGTASSPSPPVSGTETAPAPPPGAAPGVYVVALSISPPQPRRRENVTVYATFVNNTGSPQPFLWLVEIYNANSGRPIGETGKQGVFVPVGTSTLATPSNWRLTGGGNQCIPFFAQAQFQNPDGTRSVFTSTDGSVATVAFQVCP